MAVILVFVVAVVLVACTSEINIPFPQHLETVVFPPSFWQQTKVRILCECVCVSLFFDLDACKRIPLENSNTHSIYAPRAKRHTRFHTQSWGCSSCSCSPSAPGPCDVGVGGNVFVCVCVSFHFIFCRSIHGPFPRSASISSATIIIDLFSSLTPQQ